MEQQKKEKLHHSIFTISLNSNKNLNQSQIIQFDKSLNFLFSKPKVFEYLKEKRKNYKFDPLLIENYKWKKKIERGKKYKRIHAHIIVLLDHRMILEFNEKKIRYYYKNFIHSLGYDIEKSKIHLDIHGKADNVKNWEDYMFKEDDSIGEYED